MYLYRAVQFGRTPFGRSTLVAIVSKFPIWSTPSFGRHLFGRHRVLVDIVFCRHFGLVEPHLVVDNPVNRRSIRLSSCLRSKWLWFSLNGIFLQIVDDFSYINFLRTRHMIPMLCTRSHNDIVIQVCMNSGFAQPSFTAFPVNLFTLLLFFEVLITSSCKYCNLTSKFVSSL